MTLIQKLRHPILWLRFCEANYDADRKIAKQERSEEWPLVFGSGFVCGTIFGIIFGITCYIASDYDVRKDFRKQLTQVDGYKRK